jgi:hypothetical protein
MSKPTKQKIAPITIKTTVKPGGHSIWDAVTTTYLKTAMKARGIPIPKTKDEMIGRIKDWAATNGATLHLTIG